MNEPDVNEQQPHWRKRLAHGVFIVESQPTIVYCTVCTRTRKPWLANADVHALLRQVWTESNHWLMGRYVIMPDHIHFFAGWTGASTEFDNWVRYWKSMFTRSHKCTEHRWQTDHWDTRVRNAEIYEEKWIYVQENPVRHGLVARADQWPYRGELFRLVWD